MLTQEAQRSDTRRNFVVGFYDFTIILKCGNILNGSVAYIILLYAFFLQQNIYNIIKKYILNHSNVLISVCID